MCCGWSFVIKVSERNMRFLFNSRGVKSAMKKWYLHHIYREMVAPLYSAVWIWICSPHTVHVFSICVLQSVHTLTNAYVSQIMRVCLVDSMSGLCPLGRPCVARFCSNRFWQLCNFCWFLPDLGKTLLLQCRCHLKGIYTCTLYCTHTHTQSNRNNYFMYSLKFSRHTTHI